MKGLADLSPAARQIVESRSIARSFRLRPLLKLLGELQRWAAFNEHRVEVMDRWRATGCSSLFWGPLVVWYFYGTGQWRYGLVLAAATALMMFAKYRMTAYRRYDVPNEVFQPGRPMLKRLRQDIDPAAKLWLNLRLANAPAIPKKTSRKGFRSAKISVTDTCVLRIRIPFSDGSIARLRIRGRLRCLEGWKQSHARKMKKKRRWKRVCKVSIKFKPARASTYQSTSSRYQYRSDSGPPPDAPPASAALEMLIRLAAKSRPR